ncbi:MAG: hypothetical protein GVY28_14420 [Alphaproteobacteria bacterium]|jgi:hypothetical protein|nr:hypothetical protein [Alphaproteobacteria bacterium]
MTESILDPDRLDVYRLAVEYTKNSFGVAKTRSGLDRHARNPPQPAVSLTRNKAFSNWGALFADDRVTASAAFPVRSAVRVRRPGGPAPTAVGPIEVDIRRDTVASAARRRRRRGCIGAAA